MQTPFLLGEGVSAWFLTVLFRGFGVKSVESREEDDLPCLLVDSFVIGYPLTAVGITV